MQRIRRLVGDITREQLRYVDWALARDVGVFMPVVGPCGYAVAQGHTHPSCSFIVSFDDRCRTRIDGRVLSSTPGRVTAIPAGVPHEELLSEEQARYAAVMVAPRLLRRALAAHGLTALPPFRVLEFDSTPEILAGVREIMLEHASRLPGREAILDAAAVRLVHHLMRGVLGVKPDTARLPERDAIRRAADLAERHTGEPLTVHDMARTAAMSGPHFSRQFKRETGHTPQAYLRRARLERAKRLLAADDRPVTEVALECGFCSASHLATAFAREYRLPPSRYRAIMRRGRARAPRR